jgi:DNA-binding transcriptional MerR regulator
MRDVVERAGIGEATLRAWESRYGFPEPERLASGHRRYDERDVDVLRLALQLREQGLPVQAAIERARRSVDQGPRSVFAGLRRLRPELPVHVLPKRSLVAISRAIEDGCAYGAADLLLFGAFQERRFFHASERRWRELAGGAEAAFVFADFPEPRRPAGGPVEIPIGRGDPLAREWVVACDAADRAACLVGWEPPGQEGDRRFETLWTADRETARAAARICVDLALDGARDLLEPIAERLAEPVAGGPGELRRAEALTSRMVAYLASASATARRL